jgi:Ribbon-helix-helix protein, copG family
MSDASELGNGRPRKRPQVKAANRSAAGKVKATIHLSVEASQRLTVHATMMGMDRSELMESLINQHLRRFVVSDRGGPEGAASPEAAA